MPTRILSLIAAILLITISACSPSGSMTGTGGDEEGLTKIGTPVGDEPVPQKQRAITEGYLRERPMWEGTSGTELIGIKFDVSEWKISVFKLGGDVPEVIEFVIDDDGAIVTAKDAYQLDLSIEDGTIFISDAAGTFEAELVHVLNLSEPFKCESVKSPSEVANKKSNFDTHTVEDAASEFQHLGPKIPQEGVQEGVKY